MVPGPAGRWKSDRTREEMSGLILTVSEAIRRQSVVMESAWA